jgi:hypothetical protein
MDYLRATLSQILFQLSGPPSFLRVTILASKSGVQILTMFPYNIFLSIGAGHCLPGTCINGQHKQFNHINNGDMLHQILPKWLNPTSIHPYILKTILPQSYRKSYLHPKAIHTSMLKQILPKS